VKTKPELKVVVELDSIDLHGHWISSAVSTDVIAGEDIHSPHLTNRISMSVWHSDEDKHQIHLDRDVWVRLKGVWEDSVHTNTELLRGSFTLAELMLIQSTLDEFIKGIESGTISSK